MPVDQSVKGTNVPKASFVQRGEEIIIIIIIIIVISRILFENASVSLYSASDLSYLKAPIRYQALSYDSGR